MLKIIYECYKFYIYECCIFVFVNNTLCGIIKTTTNTYDIWKDYLEN